MTKNLKLTIKNPQIAGAINLGGLKEKLAKKKGESEESAHEEKKPKAAPSAAPKAAPKKAKKDDASHQEASSEAVSAPHFSAAAAAEESQDKKRRATKSARAASADHEAVDSGASSAAEKPHADSIEAPKVVQPQVMHESTKPEPKREVVAQAPVQASAQMATQAPQESKDKSEVKEKSVESSVEAPSSISKATVPPVEKPATLAQQNRGAPAGMPLQKPLPPSTSSYPQRPATSSQGSGMSNQGGNQGGRKPPYQSTSQSRPFKSSSSSSFVAQSFSARDPARDTTKSSAPQPLIRPVLPSKEPPREERSPRNEDFKSREGSYPPRREGGYPPREGGGYPPRREGGYAPREGGYPPREGGGYPPRREGGFAPREGGYPPREGGGYPPRREGGFAPRPPGSYPPRPAGGYPPRQGGYPPRAPGGYPPRPGAGAMPPRFPGAAPSGKDQTRGEEFERARKSFEDAEKRFKGKKEAGKPQRRTDGKGMDSRGRHGMLAGGDDEEGSSWRRRRSKGGHSHEIELEITRPTKIKVRLPISIKDLAQEMKLKASEVIGKLFLHGTIKTLNDLLDDATTVELVGHEFNCEIVIDTKEEERMRISNKNVREEILLEEGDNLVTRSPVVAFMGHVDHGKTSLIDAIRKSNRAQKEVGAITQHIGAFKCVTAHGPITILDTPGHEAFTLMRERGAGLTDIVVLVVAGDEGMQEQTLEAVRQAKEAKSTIVVAITKCDKPSFDKELVYRQLADQELLPEAWGGTTVAVPCSAVTQEGVKELLEMLALQSEILELRANPNRRARGMVIESEMQQGLGAVATVLVQNGTLKVGDAVVFASEWARIKGMRNEHGVMLKEAGPSTPVQITGLSGLPEAGDEFIAVKDEKEAKEIAETRKESKRQLRLTAAKKMGLEGLIAGSSGLQKKICTLILRADVQGSLEALATALKKIRSDKVELNIISENVGQISESDAELAVASKAIILGFHTGVEAHAEPLLKEKGVKVMLHNIIYHAVDEIRAQMKDMLDKLPEEKELGKAEVKMTFKASQLGVIAGCQVIEGVITRNAHVRLRRGKDVVWKGSIQSLKRVKDDVREVQKGIECGILLAGYSEAQAADIIEAYEIIYITQEL